MILTGDCIEVMRTLDADSVDAVVTDPPYGLEFMGKEWDKFVPANRRKPEWDGRRRNAKTEKWEGTVTNRGDGKPGGPSFSVDSHYKPNTKCKTCGKWQFDKNRCRCEKPDWEYRIRHEAPTQYLAFQAWCEAWGREALRVTKPGGYLLAFGGTRTHHRLVCGLEDAGWIIRDELDWIYASGFPKGKANLKPAHEPIVLARKPGPLRPLAIDACRISTTDDLNGGAYAKAGGRGESPSLHAGSGMNVPGKTVGREFEQPIGRWPSNLLLQDPDLFDVANPYVVGAGAVSHDSPWSSEPSASTATLDLVEPTRNPEQFSGYSRFFIVPKADRADREPVLRGQLDPTDEVRAESAHSTVCAKCGRQRVNVPGAACKCPDPEWVRKPQTARENSHPTVKPVDLMRHLIRLVTPVGGTVLDCFLGSGSTAIAAEMEGFAWVGIEKEPEYVAIAEARLNGTQRGLGLDVPAPVAKRNVKPLEQRSQKEQERLAKSNEERPSHDLFWMRKPEDWQTS